ncbi:MAG TPA: sensor domain-containing diguanylate cyclase [Paraburkholderia sp.]
MSRFAMRAVRHPLAVGAVGSVLALGAFALTLVTLVAARQDAIDHARDTSQSVISVLSSDVQRNFELADLSLQAVASGLRDPAVMRLDSEIRHKVLFDRSTTARYVSSISALDANGNSVEYGTGTPPKGNLSDRDYFLVHEHARNVGLYVSAPYLSRLRNGAPSIALSRRIDKADGSFGGVAVIAVNIEYFRQLLKQVAVGPHGSSLIIRSDGSVVARNPAMTGLTGFFILKSPTFRRMLDNPSGSYAARSPLDGVTRLYTFARIPGTPLIAVVAPAEADVLSAWRARSLMVGACALFVSVAFVIVVWLLAFALRDRAAMQSQLEHMAKTDSLTGLSNRRALDKVLVTEWQRMRRTGRDMSVLFIDADHFKKYNDEHGHALGDQALQRIAACLERHLRRPGDLAARYGGEEFVAVLPDTGTRGAHDVAEAIRREVEACHVGASPTSIPAVTVSIGCGTVDHSRDATLDAFMQRADAALYAAKTAGRNRVVMASPQRV